jgi:hypothetical protein
MDAVGQFVFKKGAQLATKKFLDKQFDENKGRSPGGRWVSMPKHSIYPNTNSISQDPYFEYRPNRKGRMKKVKKQIPSYIPEADAKILADVRKWAYRLDVKHNILGMRFGWSAVIGLIPELGDAIDVVLAYIVYSKCKKVKGGLDTKTKAKMKAWIVTDGVIGLVPFIGDFLDASIKCNARNCRLLEEYLDKKYKPELILAEEQKRREKNPNYHPPAPATVYEGWSEDEHDHHDHDHHDHDHHDHDQVEYGTERAYDHAHERPSQRERVAANQTTATGRAPEGRRRWF